MKTLFNLKSTLLVLLFGMTIFSVSAQKETKQEIMSDCDKVEWNGNREAPQLSKSPSNCLVVSLVEFKKEDLENMSKVSRSLSNDEVTMTFSDDRRELKIELGPKHEDAEKHLEAENNTLRYENCFVKIREQL